jgi:hypothetical protein
MTLAGVLNATIAVLAGAVVTLGVILLVEKLPEPTYEDVAWHLACELSRYDCAGVEPPWIYITPIAGWNARGVTIADRSVYIDPNWSNFEDPESMQVLVHEMVHYLQVHVGGSITNGLIRNPIEACIIEGEAFEVSNEYAVMVGREDLLTDWVKNLNCAKITVEFLEILEPLED